MTPNTGGARDLEALVHRLQRGDEDAFSAIRKHFNAHIEAYVLSIVRDPVRTQDTMQMVWVKIWETRAELTAACLENHLVGLAKTICVGRIRSRDARGNRERNWTSEHVDQGRSPLDDAADAELRSALIAAFACLANERREVLTRFLIHRQPQQEIADSLGIAVKKVENHVRRGRRQLEPLLSRFHDS